MGPEMLPQDGAVTVLIHRGGPSVEREGGSLRPRPQESLDGASMQVSKANGWLVRVNTGLFVVE